MHLVAPVRLYSSIIKLSTTSPSSSILRGHVISFRHDGPEQAAAVLSSLPNVETLSSIKVAFVGTKQEWELHRKGALASRNLQARPQVLLHFLHLKKAIDLKYASLQILDLEQITAQVSGINATLVNDAILINDAQTINMDKIVQKDVAEVREVEERTCPADPADTILLSHAFLTTKQQTAETAKARLLSTIRRTLISDREKVTASRLDDTPLNEFEENDQLYLAVFPHLFLFGHGVTHKGTLSDASVQHLLHQHTGAFAQDARFLFTAFNQKQRHCHANSVSNFSLRDPRKMEQLGELCNDSEFRKKVVDAEKDPKGDVAKEVMQTMGPLIRTTGAKTEFSPSARAAAISTLYAYVQHFGCPSVFLTFAPDDVHSVLSIRLANPAASANPNAAFPSTDAGLLEQLKKGATTFANVDLTHFGLQKLITDNPVAAASTFKAMLEMTYEHLVGIPPDHATRRTVPIGTNHKGVFGHGKAFYSVIETQGRLSLHSHMAIWTGLPPQALQKCACDQGLVAEITKVLESQFVAQLPQLSHLRAMSALGTEPAKRKLSDPIRMAYEEAPPPRCPDTKAAFDAHWQEVVNRACVHQHTSTCEKGHYGKIGCRLCFPRECQNNTGPIQLICTNRDKANFAFEPTIVISPEPAQDRRRDFRDHPLPPLDSRCIVWELARPFHNMPKLPVCGPLTESEVLWQHIQSIPDEEVRKVLTAVTLGRNEAVVETSPACCAALSCNIAAYFLGGMEQAKGVLFYLLKYLTKDQVALTHSLALIKAAMQKIDEYPSTAADTGTTLRTGKHLLTVVLNSLVGMSEVAVTQAAFSLIGGKSQEGSAKVAYVFVPDAVAAVEAQELASAGDDPSKAWNDDNVNHISTTAKKTTVANRNDDDDDDDDEFDHLFLDDDDDEPAGDVPGDASDLFQHQHAGDKVRWGGASVYKLTDSTTKETTIISVPQHIHYAHRGLGLQQLCLLEYACIIEVIQKRKDADEEDNDEANENEDDGNDNGKVKAARRPRSTLFAFGQHHPLHDSHTQRIRSKFLVPLLTGMPPPRLKQLDCTTLGYSNSTDSGKAELEKGARFYLILLSPWTLQSAARIPLPGELVPESGTSWESFAKFMERLDNPRATFIDSCKCSYLIDTARNLRIDNINKRMGVMFRSRVASKWLEKRITASHIVKYMNGKWGLTEKTTGPPTAKEKEEHEAAVKEIEKLREKSRQDDPSKPNPEQLTLYYLEHARSSILGLDSNSDFITTSPSKKMRSDHEQVLCTGADICKRSDSLWKDLKEKTTPVPIEQIAQPALSAGPQGQGACQTRLQSLIDSSDQKPTQDQLKVLQLVADHIDIVQAAKATLQPGKPPRLLLLILGGPGVGKTWTLNTIRKLLSESGVDSVSTAFTGAAASLIPGAETTHSLFSIPPQNDEVLTDLKDESVSKVAEKLQGKDCLVIDEVSMLSTVMFAKCSARAQQIFQSKEPFGGKDVILVGDFFQLRPVGCNPLFADVLDAFVGVKKTAVKAESALKLAGSAVFSQFRMVELKQQVRAAADEVQGRLLEQLRDLTHDTPVDNELLRSLSERVLSPADFAASDGWLEAPVCVTSNLERQSLTPLLAQRFARKKGVVIFTWDLPATGGLIDKLALENKLKLLPEESGLVGMFVAGAPAYLTENVHPALGLANGTLVRLHSLTFAELSPREEGELRLRISNARPGERVHLPSPPTYINVKLTLEGEARTRWPKSCSLLNDDIVIPIGLRSGKEGVTGRVDVGPKIIAGPATVTEHRVELGFVVTFHKVQGKTLEKVVLDLNHRPFAPHLTHSMLLVAISRVTHRDNLRIMPLRAGSTLGYLKALKPNPKLRPWLAGFNEEGEWKAPLVVAHIAGNKPAAKGRAKPPAQANAETKKKERARPAEDDPKPKKKEKLTEPQPPIVEPPATLQHSLKWNDNSCALDSFLESVYACALKLPGTFEVAREPLTLANVDTVLRQHQHDSTEVLLQLLSFRHLQQGDNRAVKAAAWSAMYQLWGNEIPQPGHFGAAVDWLEIFASNSHNNLLSHTYTLTTICPYHELQQEEKEINLLSITRNNLKDGLDHWRRSLDKVGPCWMPDCAHECERVASEVQAPSILAFQCNSRDLKIAPVEHLGSVYHPRAALRHLPQAQHFVAYVKHGDEWFLTDGLKAPVVTHIPRIRRSGHFMFNPCIYFYVKV